MRLEDIGGVRGKTRKIEEENLERRVGRDSTGNLDRRIGQRVYEDPDRLFFDTSVSALSGFLWSTLLGCDRNSRRRFCVPVSTWASTVRLWNSTRVITYIGSESTRFMLNGCFFARGSRRIRKKYLRYTFK